MDVLDYLIDDHHSVRATLRTLASTEPGKVREMTLEALVKTLDVHMELEERYVYPIVQRVVGAEASAGGENEHKLARDGLQQMRDLVSEPGFHAALEMVQAGLDHHVEEEEQTIFPRLRQKAAKDIDALGDADELKRSLATSRLEDATKDELYQRAKDAGIDGRSTMTKAELVTALT